MCVLLVFAACKCSLEEPVRRLGESKTTKSVGGMPISTVPHTPPRHAAGEPAAPAHVVEARQRWGPPPKPPSPQPAFPFCLLVIVLCVLLAWLYSAQRPQIAKRPAIVSFEAAPKRESVVVTATSPHALLAVCKEGKHVQVANALSVRDHPIVCSAKVDWDSLAALKHNVEVLVGFQPGLDAAFDPQFATWAREMRFLDAEDWIDESCAARRARRCSIREIPVLRAAYMWNHLARQALAASQRGFQVKMTPVASAGEALAHKQSHRALLEQVLSVQSETLGRLGADSAAAAAAALVASARDKPVEEAVDAGTCVVVQGRAAYARCLPSFIVIGAQKSGTDELSVWLNFNVYHRRMDGGIETHFFDCVGRGKGKDREPCQRGRSFAMASKTVTGSAPANDSAATLEALAAAAASSSSSSSLPGTRWSWAHFAQKTPFMDDGLADIYARLGQLDRHSFFRWPSRTLVYEKSPSYLDLADPRDVARLLPSVKIVLLTKDPVPRLFSSYWQSCESVPSSEPPCSTQEFESLAWTVASGAASSDPYGRVDTMRRALQHGMYARLLRPWLAALPGKNQLLVVDAHHMHYVPQAVVFAVETHVGNRGRRRHHVYKPHWKDGYWVLGDYSKASHPSHPAKRAMDANTTAMLTAFYRPFNAEFRALMDDANISRGAVGENIPPEYRKAHPDLFTGKGGNTFVLPPWALV